MTIQQYEPPAPLPASRPGDEALPGPSGRVARLRAAAEYANYIAGTAVVPEVLRGKPDEVAAVILTGEEVGLEPMAALRSVAMIKGVPTFKAEALRALVVSKGHELWLEDSTNTRAIAAGRRSGSERVGRVTWTMDDAKRAGIGGNANYQRYPREMLVARATAALARQLFADVVMGLVAAEELEDFFYSPNGATAEPLPPPDDAPPAGPKARRRRPAAKAPQGAEPVEPTPPPDGQPEPDVPPEPLATDAYKRRIFATMRDLGLGDGLAEDAARELRLAYASKVIGREIQTSNELTLGEASQVIEQLEADKTARDRGEQALLDELRTTFDASDLAGSAHEPAPAEQPIDPPAPHADDPADTQDTRTRLDELIVDALERRLLTVHDLWVQIATFRHRLPEQLVDELGGRNEQGRLLWQPLRDNLRADEANDLLTHLLTLRREQSPDDIPF